jgi:hypothetical protein
MATISACVDVVFLSKSRSTAWGMLLSIDSIVIVMVADKKQCHAMEHGAMTK